MALAEPNEIVTPGQRIAERYEVVRVLGQGGMGVVALAQDTQLDRPVALKFMLAEKAKDKDSVERFFREARAAGKLANEHVARVYDVGTTQGGSPYIVMEYLVGKDLGAVLEAEGLPTIETAVNWIMQACEGLAEAHGAGIIHRDLKPSNLFLTERNGRKSIKIVDFGISKMSSESAMKAGDLTSTQTSMGSPLYMSPEQMRSARSSDARSDIWALGVMLYELLTGTTPFVAESITELALVVSQDIPVPPEVLRPGVPDGLSKIVLKCLAKDPAERYFSVNALASALETYALGRSSSASLPNIFAGVGRTAGPLDSTVEAMPRVAASGSGSHRALAQTDAVSVTATPTRAPRKGPPTIAIVIGGVATAALLLSAVFIYRSEPPASAPLAGAALAITARAAIAPVAPPPRTANTEAPAILSNLPVVASATPATATKPHVVVVPSSKPATAPTTTAQSCSPPYFIDAQGHKIFKVNCL